MVNKDRFRFDIVKFDCEWSSIFENIQVRYRVRYGTVENTVEDTVEYVRLWSRTDTIR